MVEPSLGCVSLEADVWAVYLLAVVCFVSLEAVVVLASLADQVFPELSVLV